MTDWWPEAFDRERWCVGTGEHPDRVLAQLARRQHTVVHGRQLAALGVTRHHLRRRLGSGHVKRVAPQVYALEGATLSAEAQRMVAVLSGGAGARLAGGALAAHLSLIRADLRVVDLVIPAVRRVDLPGVNVRRAALRPYELAVFNGIPSTSVARMLLDLAATTDRVTVEWAWRQAIYRRHLDAAEILRLLVARQGERGTATLRDLYVRREKIIGAVLSRFELVMAGIIRDAGLPEPELNQTIVVGDRRLRPDLLVREARLAVEFDGRDGHADPEFVLSDQTRDALYRSVGLTPLRYGFYDVTRERTRVLAEVADVWARRRSPAT